MSPAAGPKPEAPPELLVLQRWEEHATWLIEHSNRWPKSLRFSLAQRLQGHAPDLIEMLVQARYEPGLRAGKRPTVVASPERPRAGGVGGFVARAFIPSPASASSRSSMTRAR